MARVCRPGGQVAVLEFSMPAGRPLRAVYDWYFRRVLPRIGQALAGDRRGAYNYLRRASAEFPFGEAMVRRMEHSGLREVRSHPFTFGLRPSTWDSKGPSRNKLDEHGKARTGPK